MLTSSKLVDVDRGRALRGLGYGTHNEPPGRIGSIIDEHLNSAPQLTDTSYSYVIREVTGVYGVISFIEDSIVFKSQVIARLLEQCQKVAIFALTIGDRLERKVSQLAKERLILEASILDVIGSVAAETLANTVQDEIGDIARYQGLTISQRFSPGYCDWDIGQQRMLFWALRDDTAGIHLTDSCLMIPQKSISGIIGIGTTEIVSYNPCKTCDKRECRGRR